DDPRRHPRKELGPVLLQGLAPAARVRGRSENPALKTILREPLVHFLLLGAGLFVAFRLTGGGAAEPVGRIVISTAEVERLSTIFSRLWLRPPTAEELRGLIEKEIREEVYSREAMAMGLDREDTVIRRRLQQKLEFLSEDIAAQQKPTEAQLQVFLDGHREKFRTEARLTFRQVYVGRERRGASAERDAKSLLVKLRAQGAGADVERLGDRISIPSDFEGESEKEVGRTFGQAFPERLMQLSTGRWEGPIESGYGLHLVLVKERVAGTAPTLAQVREAVEREWQAERRLEANESFYKALRARYTVTVELPGWARAAAPKADRVDVR
ncbi:MAG: peptidyl-prolyl cis-trans isomerase, partial [Thermoanaerobaculia bacterium]